MWIIFYFILISISCIESSGILKVWDGKDIYDDKPDVSSNGNSSESIGVSSTQATLNSKKLLYGNGRIMTGKVRVNFVFYGKDWSPDAVYKFQHLIEHIDGTPYFSILKPYKDRLGNEIAGPIVVDKTVMLSNIYGNQITDEQVFQAIKRAFPNNDVSAQYVFMSDSNTQVVLGKYRTCEHFW